MNDMPQGSRPFWKSRSAIVLAASGSIAVFLLFSEHRAHFLGVLPYLLLLSCPLMHVFMHRRHHSHHGHGSHVQAQRAGRKESGDSHERDR
ncbi:DUF2933 domain-containing protein [Burkholderia sp. WSM2232]|uniref:DUF2933 domain-containing protein n=1 Tax=Burkholderia sp. WSM2232 TaxID=944436 RepID=UPI0004268D82|nr:DUF2933 domain-containing protein [Burkholderia sp. WSM2232]